MYFFSCLRFHSFVSSKNVYWELLTLKDKIMRTFTKTLIALCLLLGFGQLQAQVTAEAGNDQSICAGTLVTLGGAPTAVGGTPPYTYAWSPAAGLSNSTIANPLANPVATTTYSVIVTDMMGATGTDTITVYVSPGPILDSIVSTAALCHDPNVILACVYPSGGTQPYVYNWSNGYTPQCLSGGTITSGMYSVTVVDNDGCSVTASTMVTHPAQLQIVVDSLGDASCANVFDGKIKLSATGGTPPYSYVLNGGPPQASAVFTGLSSGIYMAGVVDANGCTDTITVAVGETYGVTLNLLSQAPVSCFGSADGALTIELNGGIQPYGYSINGVSWWPTGVFTGLPAGTYTAMGRDDRGCRAEMPIAITEPAQIQLSTVITNASCNGVADGAIDITATGGNSPYSFSWTGGINIQDPVGLVAGTYYVTVADSNLCEKQDSFLIIEPSQLQFSGFITNAACFGGYGSADITAYGGTLPYSFAWSDGSVNEDIDSLLAGTYTVTITDLHDCTASYTFTITQPTQLQLSAVVTNVDCYGSPTGAIDLTVSGGTPAYNYSWIPGNIFIDDPTGLVAGTYNVTVVDTNLCTATASYVMSEPSHLQISSITTTNVTCFGAMDGSACIHTSGGTPYVGVTVPPNTYIWSWGNNTDTCSTGLSAGSYSVTFTDANYCTVSGQFTINEPAQFTAYLESTNGGQLPDTLLTIYSGGTPPYSFLGSNATTVPYMYIDYSELASCFSAMVTDSNGCSAYTDTICYDCVSGGCVWPGDADNNGIADNNDLLPIGLAYGTTGIYRYQQGTQWLGYIAANWPDTLADGTNYKHIDCNGNGIINADDTLAIIQNYGLVHNKTEDEIEWRMNVPALLVQLEPDSTQAGDTMYANLVLGDANMAAANVYGLAFTINYDVNVVDTLRTRAVFGNSWLGTATDKISIAKDLKQGQIKCAVTRIDHTSRTGAGQIGQATFVITTDNINGKSMAYYKMHVWLSDVMMIDNLGQILEVNAGQDSTEVEFDPLSVGSLQLAAGSLKIQPNPANDVVQITVTRELLGGNLKVMDMEGRSLMEKVVNTTTLKLETDQLSAGIYLLQVNTTYGKITRRLVIAR